MQIIQVELQERELTIASGNDNANATPEVLVAIGGLAGT